MEPRSRNSSGPVEAMLKAGQTTVLTKRPLKSLKTLAMQEPPTEELGATCSINHYRLEGDILRNAALFSSVDDRYADKTDVGIWACC